MSSDVVSGSSLLTKGIYPILSYQGKFSHLLSYFPVLFLFFGCYFPRLFSEHLKNASVTGVFYASIVGIIVTRGLFSCNYLSSIDNSIIWLL